MPTQPDILELCQHNVKLQTASNKTDRSPKMAGWQGLIFRQIYSTHCGQDLHQQQK